MKATTTTTVTTVFTSTLITPVGPFSLAVDAAGAVVATAFGEADALAGRLPGPAHFTDNNGTASTASARTQLKQYFAGERMTFDLPLAPVGSAFQQRVWDALCTIPLGETRSYGELARALESSPRAVGRANATNPICLIVPCHRVIGADGALTGFAFGTAIKQWLLAHERGVGAPADGLAGAGSGFGLKPTANPTASKMHAKLTA